jgi:hypothetical protein
MGIKGFSKLKSFKEAIPMGSDFDFLFMARLGWNVKVVR